MQQVVPQAPPGWPLIGQGAAMARDPLGFITRLQRDYGDAVGFSYGRKAVLVSHPDAIERVFYESGTHYDKGYQADFATRQVLGNGLVTSEGAFWQAQRAVMQPAFHGKRIHEYAQTMVDYTVAKIADWQADTTRDLHHEMLMLTQRIVAQVLFGKDVLHAPPTLTDALNVLIDDNSSMGIEALLPAQIPTPNRWRLQKAVNTVDQWIHTLVAERRTATDEHHDLLAMMLAARDDQEQPMTAQQLRDELVTMYLAGHETTSNTLTFAWMLLAQHPDVWQHLTAELDAVLAGRLPTAADLRGLRYADAVIKETMRLYPSIWAIARVARHDVEIGGFAVAKATEVILSQWVTHHDPRWFPDPMSFLPGRWLDGSTKSNPRYAFFSFGGGPRVCIGNSFAQMEAVLLLATIAQRHTLALPPKHALELVAGTTLRPRGGLQMRIGLR